MADQTLLAVREADVVVFLVDGRAGLVPLDHDIAELLRREARRTVLCVNKVDGIGEDRAQLEFHELGFERTVPRRRLPQPRRAAPDRHDRRSARRARGGAPRRASRAPARSSRAGRALGGPCGCRAGRRRCRGSRRARATARRIRCPGRCPGRRPTASPDASPEALPHEVRIAFVGRPQRRQVDADQPSSRRGQARRLRQARHHAGTPCRCRSRGAGPRLHADRHGRCQAPRQVSARRSRYSA